MRFNKTQWLKKGLEILEQHGPQEIKVDRLCTHLHVTKGSFYHHFKNRAMFVTELLAYWREENTDGIIQQVDQQTSPEQQNDLLNQLSISASATQENAIRAWGVFEPRVAREVEAVDKVRIDYLERLIQALIPELPDSQLITKMVYAKFIGAQQLNTLINTEEHLAMSQLLKDKLSLPSF